MESRLHSVRLPDIKALSVQFWTICKAVPAIPTMILLIGMAFYVQPRMLSLPFLFIILRQTVPLGMVAMGQSLPIVGRSIDLSVGGVIALVNVVLSMRYFADSPVWVSFVVPILIGLVVGLVNSVFVVFVRASAVVVTLGMSVILLGLSYLLSGGAPGGDIHEVIETISRGRIARVPYAGICMLALCALLSFLLHRTVFGHSLIATGGNYRASRLSGISVFKELITSHVVCSVFAALAGIFLTGYIGTGTLNLGANLVMASVAAVVLGGTNFGSSSGIFGVLLGAFVLTFLNTLLTAMGVDKPVQLILQGAIIAGAAMLSSYRQ